MHVPYVEELLSCATGKDNEGRTLLTIKDMSGILGKRRAECKATNKEYSLSFFHKVFGSAKYVVYDGGISLMSYTPTAHPQC